MPRIRSSDDEFSDSSAVRKLKNPPTTVNSPLRRSSRIKEIKEHSPKQLRGRTVRAASECSSPAIKATRRTRASSVDPDEVASPARPKRRVIATTPLEEEPDETSASKVTTRRKAAVGKTTKPKENLDTSKETVKGTRKSKKSKDLDSSKESTEAEERDEEHSTKSDEKSMEKKEVLKGSDENNTDKEIRIVLERVCLDNQVQNDSLKNTEIKDEPSDRDEIAEIVSLDGSVSSSGISSILESDLGRRKQHFDFNEDIREKSKKLIEKYKIPLEGVEVIEISGPDTDAEVIVDGDDEDQVHNKDSSLIIPIYNSTLLCDKTDTDNIRKLFVNGSSPVAGTEDKSKEEKTERPKTPLGDVVEVAESDDEIFSPTRTAKKKSDPPVVETVETIEKVPSETDPVEKPEESQLSSQDSLRLCLEEKNTENEVEVLQKETPIKSGSSRRKSVTFAVREPSLESNDEDDFTQRMDNFFNNRTPAKKFGDQSLFDSTTVVDESEPMDHEDITSPEKSLKIGREDENKPEEIQAEKDNSVANEKDETLGDISRKATKDSDSESLNSSFEIDESKSGKNVQKASEDSDDTSVKDSEKGEEIDLNRSRKSISKERRSLTKIDPVVEETENESDEKTESLNKSKDADVTSLNESRKSIDRVRKSSSKMVLVDSEDSVDDLLDKAVNKSLNKSKEDRQSLSKSIQEEIQSRRKSSEKESSKIESPQKRSGSRNSSKLMSSDEEEVEASKLNKSKQEESAKDSQPEEEIVISSDKISSDDKEEEEREEMEVDEETVQSKSNENENEEEDSPAFSPLEDSSEDETAAPKERKSFNASQTNKTEETEDPKPRKSLNQSQKAEISRKSLEMEKENIENDKIDKTLDTSEKQLLNQSIELASASEDVESVSMKKRSVTPQKRQSLQLEVEEEEHETLNKSRKSLNEIKALKEVSNSPVKERKSLPSSIKEICQKVELSESVKRRSLDLKKEKKVRESLEKRQSMVVDSEEEEEEPQETAVKSRKSLNQSKVEEKLDTSKSRQSLKKQSMEVDSEEEEEDEPQEKSIKTRKSLNQSKIEEKLDTSKSRQSLKKQSMEVDSEEEEEDEPQEKSIKTRKSLNQSKVEKELETSKSRKSLNSSKKVDQEETDLSNSRKSLNQSKKTEEKLETSSRKSLNKSKKSEEDVDSSTNTDKSLEKSQDNESDEEESNLNDTYISFIEAVVTSKPLAIDSEDGSVSIDEKDLDKTTSEDDDLEDEEEEFLDSQDKEAGEIDQSGVRKLKKSLEADFKVNDSLKANKSLNKSAEKKEKSMNDSKAKIPPFMYSASESEDDTQNEMDADILKEYNLDGETIVEYSDDDVIADDIRASETESSEDENDSDLADFIVDEVSEEEEEDDDEEKVSDEEEDGEDEDEENEKEEQEEEKSIEEKQTEQEEKKTEVLEKSMDKKRKSDVAKIDEPGKSRQSIGKNKTILLESDDENEVMNYDESCIIEEDTNLGKPVIKSILSTRVQMSTPNTGNKISRISKSFENVSALDSTLLVADANTSASKKSKSRKSESRKSLHQSLSLPEESSPEEQHQKVKSSLSKTLVEGSETPVTKHLKKAKMNDTEPIIKLPDESSQMSEKKKKKKKSLGEAMVEIINTDVPTIKINDESLNKSSKKKDKTLVEENEAEVEQKVEEVKKKNKKQKNKTNEENNVKAVEEVEEVKKKNKKEQNKTNEVVEKKEKSKKKKVLEIEDVEVPSTYSIESDKSEDRKAAKKANKKKQIEVQNDDALIEEKPKKTKKRAAETDMAVQGKRKRKSNESDESVAANLSKNRETEIASLKRRRDDLSASFSEVRIKKRQRTDDVKIVASAFGSTTHFRVVPITKQKSKAPKALQSYRQRMLSRNPMQSATTHDNYQLKLKAAGRNRF